MMAKQQPRLVHDVQAQQSSFLNQHLTQETSSTKMSNQGNKISPTKSVAAVGLAVTSNVSSPNSSSNSNSNSCPPATGGSGAGGKQKPSYKHVPHSQKPPHLVAKRNARERRRVQAVNQAFYKLRRCVPIENRNKRVSKVKTLQRAIDYIRKLERILADDTEVGELAAGTSGEQQQHQRQNELGGQSLAKALPPRQELHVTPPKCDISAGQHTNKVAPKRRGRKPATATADQQQIESVPLSEAKMIDLASEHHLPQGATATNDHRPPQLNYIQSPPHQQPLPPMYDLTSYPCTTPTTEAASGNSLLGSSDQSLIGSANVSSSSPSSSSVYNHSEGQHSLHDLSGYSSSYSNSNNNHPHHNQHSPLSQQYLSNHNHHAYAMHAPNELPVSNSYENNHSHHHQRLQQFDQLDYEQQQHNNNHLHHQASFYGPTYSDLQFPMTTPTQQGEGVSLGQCRLLAAADSSTSCAQQAQLRSPASSSSSGGGGGATDLSGVGAPRACDKRHQQPAPRASLSAQAATGGDLGRQKRQTLDGSGPFHQGPQQHGTLASQMAPSGQQNGIGGSGDQQVSSSSQFAYCHAPAVQPAAITSQPNKEQPASGESQHHCDESRRVHLLLAGECVQVSPTNPQNHHNHSNHHQLIAVGSLQQRQQPGSGGGSGGIGSHLAAANCNGNNFNKQLVVGGSYLVGSDFKGPLNHRMQSIEYQSHLQAHNHHQLEPLRLPMATSKQTTTTTHSNNEQAGHNHHQPLQQQQQQQQHHQPLASATTACGAPRVPPVAAMAVHSSDFTFL